MESGYIKYWRNAKDNAILANDNNAFIVFMRLLILVDRHTGSYTTGRKKLATYMNMKESTLYKVLKRLESVHMLECKSNSHVTTFSICNWTRWQQDGNSIVKRSYEKRSTKQEEEREVIDTKVSMSSSNELQRLHSVICEMFGKDEDKFKQSDARKSKLKLRVKELGAERVEAAIRKLSQSEFHRGLNDRGWKVDTDPYWLFSSFEKTETWANKDEVKSMDLSKIEIEV